MATFFKSSSFPIWSLHTLHLLFLLFLLPISHHNWLSYIPLWCAQACSVETSLYFSIPLNQNLNFLIFFFSTTALLHTFFTACHCLLDTLIFHPHYQYTYIYKFTLTSYLKQPLTITIYTQISIYSECHIHWIKTTLILTFKSPITVIPSLFPFSSASSTHCTIQIL